MTYPRQTTAGLAVDTRARKAHLSTARSDRRPQRAMPLTRRYEVAGLTPAGLLTDFSSVAPATPIFEEAFAGFARGTLIGTVGGPVAIEDLTPGMEIETVGQGPRTLLWVGSMTIFPSLPDVADDDVRLTRIVADTFGLGRPMPDLLLGPRARLLFRHAGCGPLLGSQSAFAPARSFADGSSVIAVRPVAPVRVYHLALDGQYVICANGVEVESYHPGTHADSMMNAATQDLFLGLFPHARTLEDFGPMPHPRLTAFELENLRAA